MTGIRWSLLPAMALLAFQCESARAHSFTGSYRLPVPFHLYAYAAAWVLLMSFAACAVFARRAGAKSGGDRALCRCALRIRLPHWALTALRICSLIMFVILLLSGLFGTQNSFENFSMTFFWVVVVVGGAYVAALVGDFDRLINPWRAVCVLFPRCFVARVTYPGRLSFYPAFVFYTAFIALELFGETTPKKLSIVLLCYTVMTLIFAYIFGARKWLRYGEFFGIYFGVFSRLACLRWNVSQKNSGVAIVRWRRPFSGLERPAPHLSMVLFVLAMLSSTAYDGLSGTKVWNNLYWNWIFPAYADFLHFTASNNFELARNIQAGWEGASMAIAPGIYLLIFIAFMAASGIFSGARRPSAVKLAREFAFTLIPIALVYHISHYYTSFIYQAPQIVRLVSDPLGFGWNLLGTAGWTMPVYRMSMSTLWRTQVVLIVVGHAVAVHSAHRRSLQLFGTRWRAMASQIPMLGLMIVFTIFGLWILSLPLSGN